MNEWRKVKLREIGEITSSKRIFRAEYKKVGVPFYRGKEIIQKANNQEVSDEFFISLEKYEEIKNKYSVPLENDILITSVGTVGIPYIVKNEKFYFKDGNINWIKKYANNIYFKYLYYWFISPIGKNQIDSYLIGSTQKALTIEAIKKLEINLPPLNTQKKIAKILSDIDSKVELNNTINNNLEKQVQLIFNNHFFNKDKNYTNYISSNLLEIADFLNGLAMQKYTPNDFNEKSYPVLKIKELNQGFTDKNSDRCSNKIKSEYIINNGDIIFSWSGTLLIKIWCGNKCGLNQHLFKVTSKKYDKWFYFLWINYHLKKFISIAKDKATTMGHIKRADLEKAFVLIPPEKEYESLNKILTPLFENIISNKKENNHLVNLKNYLLPKLMNGEIDIENIEL